MSVVYIIAFKKKTAFCFDHASLLTILQDLLFSYNIAVDRSDEVKKTLGKSAASVGLQLPEVYQ